MRADRDASTCCLSTQYILNLESGSENLRHEHQYLHIEIAMDVKYVKYNILKFIKTFLKKYIVFVKLKMTCRTTLYVANLAVFTDRA